MRKSTIFLKKVFKNKELEGAEIGVQAGTNAISINENLNMKKLYLIDIWGDYTYKGKIHNLSELYKDVKKLFNDCKNVEIIKGDSVQIVKRFKDNSLDFVYIDANHQYEYVKKDIEIWFPKVKNGGYLMGHDYTPVWKGVVKAIEEFVKEKNFKLDFSQQDWWFKKEDKL